MTLVTRNQDEVLLARLQKEMQFVCARFVDLEKEISELSFKLHGVEIMPRLKITPYWAYWGEPPKDNS